MLLYLIDEKAKNQIEDWLYYAKPNEKKGLFTLHKVVINKGEKTFYANLNPENSDYTTGLTYYANIA
jgi:hypothetical protein